MCGFSFLYFFFKAVICHSFSADFHFVGVISSRIHFVVCWFFGVNPRKSVNSEISPRNHVRRQTHRRHERFSWVSKRTEKKTIFSPLLCVQRLRTLFFPFFGCFLVCFFAIVFFPFFIAVTLESAGFCLGWRSFWQSRIDRV